MNTWCAICVNAVHKMRRKNARVLHAVNLISVCCVSLSLSFHLSFSGARTDRGATNMRVLRVIRYRGADLCNQPRCFESPLDDDDDYVIQARPS